MESDGRPISNSILPFQPNEELDVDKSYRHRPLNFYLEPFYFPPPVCLTRDVNDDRIMLWDLSTISLQKPST